ncbi:MAG: hypothetical protein M1817_006027 [Caeruleum heppii]|nr:MAG: hypothetical protein M1817_006027 [Caeruleum heppii]
MGIPIFREPSAAEPPRAKVDPTAPARSMIRRSRSVRHSRRHRNDAPRRHSPHNDPSLARTQRLLDVLRQEQAARSPPTPSAYSVFGDDFTRRERDTINDAHYEMLARQNELLASEADTLRTLVSDRQRLETDRPLLRDALSYERPPDLDRHSSLSLDLAVGSPASRDSLRWGSRPQAVEPRFHNLSDLERLRPEHERDASLLDTTVDNPHLASSSYTTRFAPAYAHSSHTREPVRPAARRADTPRAPETIARSATSGPNASNPLLGRIRRRSVGSRRSPLSRPNNSQTRVPTTVDGLGDRDRSMSPEDSWDTLLTTITPDHHLPSTDSSFTSATATATASASSLTSNPISASTSITTPDESDEGITPCDDNALLDTTDTDDFDTEADDDDDDSDDDGASSIDIRVNRHRAAAAAAMSTFGEENATPRAPTFQRQMNARIPPRIPHGPTYPHSRSPRERSTQSGDQDDEWHWTGMQHILGSLARREDIPDEWWAAAGLSRTLPPGGRMERF